MSFSRGKTIAGLTINNEFSQAERSALGLEDRKFTQGTKVRFTPDEEIFKSTLEFEYDRLAARLDELAYLNPGLKFNLETI